jgi:hypothetical protein
MRAEIEVSQEEMKAMVRASQENMKTTRNSIRSRLEETIKNRVGGHPVVC